MTNQPGIDRTGRGWASGIAARAPFLRLCRALLVSTACAGCGSGLPQTAPVTGTVSWNGKLLTQGKVGFFPERGVPAFGDIQSDGRYSLSTFAADDGAVLGRHRVTIQSLRVVASQPPPQTFAEEVARATAPQAQPRTAPRVEWIVPQRFEREETSGLTAEVKPEPNVVNFELREE